MDVVVLGELNTVGREEPPQISVANLLIENPGDVPVTLELQLPDRTVRIATKENLKICFGPALAASIEGLLGQGSVRERYQGAAV